MGQAMTPLKVRSRIKTDPIARSANMRAIRSKDTRPEMIVRRMVHALGFRFRLHRMDLPGRPDLVFPSKKKLIFVHGCFWHSHGCARAHAPRSNLDYWQSKLERNRKRDAGSRRLLNVLGWKSLVVWECDVKKLSAVSKKIERFLRAKRE